MSPAPLTSKFKSKSKVFDYVDLCYSYLRLCSISFWTALKFVWTMLDTCWYHTFKILSPDPEPSFVLHLCRFTQFILLFVLNPFQNYTWFSWEVLKLKFEFWTREKGLCLYFVCAGLCHLSFRLCLIPFSMIFMFVFRGSENIEYMKLKRWLHWKHEYKFFLFY